MFVFQRTSAIIINSDISRYSDKKKKLILEMTMVDELLKTLY